ncbi:unnamed protein product [Effrenium voratum]|uniref:Protein kinase domain-containing protein n=1 Tax=Effrenium voratum TaxID=2562239 RepID=A0AA36I7D0_9DINO|nr:unnamed protein product [Effrenium voratum]
MGTDDLPDAYRGLPVLDERLPFSVVAIWVPHRGWRYTVLWGLAFGLESAVVAFNRFPQLGVAAARRCTYALAAAYFDDELSVETVLDANISQRGLFLLFTGCSTTAAEEFQPGKLRGDLTWMFTMVSGHMGRLAQPIITKYQHAANESLQDCDRLTLQLLALVVRDHSPRTVTVCGPERRPLVIYSDASFEKGSLRLGWVVMDPDDIAACELDPCPLDCILEERAGFPMQDLIRSRLGCLVRLLQQLRQRHPHPEPVSDLCGLRGKGRNAAGEAGEAPARFQDKYRLGRQIGVGTYGFVYDVQSRRAPQMKRAAKVIGITASEEAERRLKSLQREVDLWHRVSVAAGGQGVVQLFEVFVGHGFLAAVMEHCGPSLMDCAPEISRMKAAGVAHIFREMLKPIVFLHNLRIVHRDIKPENFLFCHQIDRSEVKLCDFGLATEMPTIGLRSGRYGTLPYMSPEMVGYSGHGFPTDLWSFGASAYYLLFNEFAYGFQKNGCPQTMAASIQSGQPQPRFFSLAQQIRTTSGQQAIGLLTSLLKHKSNDRVSAREAQNLPFLTKRFRTDPQKYLAGEYRSHCCKELSTSIEL